jgi:hypothetical protein
LTHAAEHTLALEGDLAALRAQLGERNEAIALLTVQLVAFEHAQAAREEQAAHTSSSVMRRSPR